MSGLRMVRIGLLVAFLILVVTLHGHGSTYNDIHIVYLVLVVGILIFAVTQRRRQGGMGRGGMGRGRMGRGGMGRGGPDGGSTGSGSYGTPRPPPPPISVDNPDPEAGGPIGQ
jgi:hypothetical protein